MNKKNKNKNRNKPTTVSAPQKIEPPSVVEAVLPEENPTVTKENQTIVNESDSVIVVSEVTVPITEENIMASETPKKPKRNKGKKKKHDELDLDESKTATTSVNIPTDAPSEIEENIERKTGLIESKTEEGEKNAEESVTPNVRKKKNKKKQSEQVQVESKDEPKIETSSHEIIPTETLDMDLQKENITETTTKTESGTSEVKDIIPSKKKNKKKKNRLDSEKSDKVEDIISCTAAFEKLVASKDNESDIKLTENDPSESVTSDKEITISPKEETLKELIESVLLPEIIQEPEKEQVKDEQSKNKKKNKKDKKQQQQKQTEQNLVADIQITQQTSTLNASSDTPQEIPKVDLDKEVTSGEPIKSEITDTKIKAKAKIAKPVEKPRKVKIEPSEDSNKEPEDEVIVIEPQKSQSTTNIAKAESTEKNVTTSDLIIDPIDIQSSEITTKQQTNENIDNITIDTAEPLTNIDVTSPVTEAPIADSPKPSDEKTIEEITTPELTEVSDLIPSAIDKEITVEPEEKETPSVSEPYKIVEKKKKKHPKKIDVASNVPTDKTPEYKVLTTPESESVKEDCSEKPKEEIDFELPTAADVEISSIKNDDKEGSTDVTPDFIHHPLASSQTLLDDNNNNMFIREITSTDEKIFSTLLTPNEPIIQGSGETSEPKFIPLILQRERSKTNELDEQKSEKTDLKSKMMEVSQDMEELRLSIERSLAELTSMEKSEQEVEKEFEQTDAPRLGIVTESIGTAVDEKASEECQIKSTTIKIDDTAVTAETSHEIPNTTEPIESKIEKIDLAANIPADIKTEDVKTSSPNPYDQKQKVDVKEAPPIAPARKDQKGKGKGKKKGKQEAQSQQTSTATESTTTSTTESTQEVKKEDKSEQKPQQSESNDNKSKQKASFDNDCNGSEDISQDQNPSSTSPFDPIENFEDALTSSVDDVNKTFEMIASEVSAPDLFQNPEINIIAPDETEAAQPKQNPVSPPKNLLGQPDIPVPSNRTDYKKERNKPPNMRQAKVKIKDAVDIDKAEKQSKESQTDNKRKLNNKNALESFAYMTNENAEYVYKYSFRKVFLQSLCHVCRKEMSQRVPCHYCSLVFYCSQKHKDEDWPQHQTLCFAVCTIVHLKDQKHIFADAKDITGHNYRLLRMQMIVACEKVLKRKLVPWEQEAFLYPRVCADVACREWKQSKLTDCQGCGQISYCSEHPDHLPSSHQRWCRSYALYQKLVHHQQTKGRLEPKLPTRVMPEGYRIPEKITEALASMFDEKIDMTDMEYAALTQLATAPLTAAYCHQDVNTNANGISKKSSLVVHIVGADLQFEADVLFKWEMFFLHLKPDVKELRVVLVGQELNPSNLPLDLLGKIKLCESCIKNKRRVSFSFQDKKSYYEYWASDEFSTPDIVCAFNQSIQRSSVYNGKDTWPSAISCILKLKAPFIISSYSTKELARDLDRIKECSESCGVGFKVVTESRCNSFASVRPDRNFITDDEIPLLFKNYVVTVLCGV